MDTVKCTRHATFARLSHPEETRLVNCERPVHILFCDEDGTITDFACKASRRLAEPTQRIELARCTGCGAFLAHEIGEMYAGERCAACIAKPPPAKLPPVEMNEAMNDLLDLAISKAKMCNYADCPALATKLYEEEGNAKRCDAHAIEGADGTEIVQAPVVVKWWPYAVRRAELGKG